MIKTDCTTCMARDLHFSFLKSTQTGFGVSLYHPVGAGFFFLRVKQVGQEADLSPSFIAEFPNLTLASYYSWYRLNRVSTRDEFCRLIEVTVTAVWHMPGIFQDTGNSWHHRAHLCIWQHFQKVVLTFYEWSGAVLLSLISWYYLFLLTRHLWLYFNINFMASF